MNAEKTRDLQVKEQGQHYARVTKLLGNNRVVAMCKDGVEWTCTICGKMRKREWVNAGDIVLVVPRGCNDDKAELVFRYTDGEIRHLRRLGEEVTFTLPGDKGCVDDFVQFEQVEDDNDDIS